MGLEDWLGPREFQGLRALLEPRVLEEGSGRRVLRALLVLSGSQGRLVKTEATVRQVRRVPQGWTAPLAPRDLWGLQGSRGCRERRGPRAPGV